MGTNLKKVFSVDADLTDVEEADLYDILMGLRMRDIATAGGRHKNLTEVSSSLASIRGKLGVTNNRSFPILLRTVFQRGLSLVMAPRVAKAALSLESEHKDVIFGIAGKTDNNHAKVTSHFYKEAVYSAERRLGAKNNIQVAFLTVCGHIAASGTELVITEEQRKQCADVRLWWPNVSATLECDEPS